MSAELRSAAGVGRPQAGASPTLLANPHHSSTPARKWTSWEVACASRRCAMQVVRHAGRMIYLATWPSGLASRSPGGVTVEGQRYGTELSSWLTPSGSRSALLACEHAALTCPYRFTPLYLLRACSVSHSPVHCFALWRLAHHNIAAAELQGGAFQLPAHCLPSMPLQL